MSVIYNDEQLEAINSNDKNILVLACAGAGKSTTLVSRAARLIKDGESERSILCLTFTNKAGAEMSEKFRRMFPNMTHIPEFRTFHAFCYSLIVRDKEIRNLLGYDKIPSIASDAMVKEAREIATLQTKIKLSDDILSGKQPCPPRDRIKLETWNKSYKKYLARLGLITFDIMANDVSSLFIKNHDSSIKYKKKYEHIMVDEFQDTDTKQFKFVASFNESNFFLVGDALQAIYAFRGADNRYIKMLSRDDSWKKIRMNTNYRSTREICDFANDMSTYADENYRLELQSIRSGLDVEVMGGGITSFDKRVDKDHLDNVIRNLNVCRDTSGAILCRTNMEVKEVIDELSRRGISCTNSKKHDEIIPIIKSAGDTQYEMEYLASTLLKEQYNNWLRVSYGNEVDINFFLETFKDNKAVTRIHNKIEKIREILNTSEDAESKAELILMKFKLIGIHCKPKENTTECIISSLVETIESFQEASLYVGTIHSVKGLEYHTVFVLGVNQGVWKLDSEDNLNLYYVAITRAKERLFVYTS